MPDRTAYRRRALRRRGGGFTLVEVLAALMLVAIVLPVAMRGVTVATAAASSARHRNEAAALAQSKLDELLANMQVQQSQMNSSMSGDFGADWPEYQWSAELGTWAPNGMNMTTGLSGQLPSALTQTGTTGAAAGGSSGATAGAGSTAATPKSNQNNTLQELDVHVTWTGRSGQQTLTLGTLVYQSGNATTSTTSGTGF